MKIHPANAGTGALFERRITIAGLLFVLLYPSLVLAQHPSDPRGLVIKEINETPTFLVRVDVDHPDRIYRNGDEMRASVRSERAGYLYLFYCDADKRVTCLFPNQMQSENRIPANETVVIPPTSGRFRLRIGAPFGAEVLKAVVTTEPLKALELRTLTRAVRTPVEPRRLKGVFVEVSGGNPGEDPTTQDTQRLRTENRNRARHWAEHQVEITTLAANGRIPDTPRLQDRPNLEDTVTTTHPVVRPQPGPTEAARTRPKRVGVFIGIDSFQDKSIRPLKTPQRDAELLAQVMKQQGKLDEVIVLVNQQATLRNLAQVICKGLPAATRPGDLVILYWSGHGGRIANLDGTEPDGYDEYLVPYDGQLAEADTVRKTMLLDKTFGRWVQELDGRKLVVIIDACHSGGQTQDAVKALTGGDPRKPFRKFFFATTYSRTKDIGQRETAVLASSRASQVSFERREGDLSVMTYFLIERLSSGTGPVTLSDAFNYVKKKVPTFVEQHFPGTTQTPVFVDHMTPPLYLRP